MAKQFRLPLNDELIVDNFAGGGGASTGIEAAFGRPVDIAVNHDREAIAMHMANHPHTRHYCESVWDVDPIKVTGGQPVGLAWFSPDCKHFSKAKGGKPVEKNIRGLAWVATRWAAKARPRVIMLENVEEFRTWGPLVRGEDGSLYPCPERKGLTFRRWVRELQRFGYRVEHEELRASDYGTPTSRKRLFLIARCDGLPIVWREPTHGPGRLPYRTAAECIDWSIPCPSIFTRERPLAEATMRRIAQGIKRFVLDAAEPFIVTNTTGNPPSSVRDPLKTVTTGGNHLVVAPYIVPRYGERPGQTPRTHAVDEPIPTITPDANAARLVMAFMAQHNTGMTGHPMTAPVSTIVGKGCTQGLVTSHLVKLRGTCKHGQDVREPMPTVTAGGQHIGEVRAFLVKYYGTAIGQDPRDPMHTLTTKARMGLVTVAGADYQIVDIGMRMLTPRELYRAQGFPDSYIIDPTVNGKPLSKASQVRMVGNSVCPPIARALVEANFAHEEAYRQVG